MSDYDFTTDWCASMREEWPVYVPRCKSILEIGSYEGRGACWMIENILEPEGFMVCLDTWQGGEEHDRHAMDEVLARFTKNFKLAREKHNPNMHYSIVKGDSAVELRRLNKTFDLIYVDGSHQAPDVLTDAVMAWQLLQPEGIMIFDDYGWQGHELATHRPKMAINAFLSVFSERLTIIHQRYQIAIRKNA